MLIATAGHIDHGKTALVRALTGVDTDRLPEEKARGISIDLGFAYWQPEPEVTIGFIDVPGHERFVRNMLAGVSAVNQAMLVVAADDGVMPQTIEHLDILDLMGISQGIAVISKCDRASPDRINAVREELQVLLAPTGLASAPIIAVSALNGAGMEHLAALLLNRAGGLEEPRGDDRLFRMAIDRAFTVNGAGTVVTGTIVDGSITTGDTVTLSPTGLHLRVRGLQSAGQSVGSAGRGQRCAINLAAIDVAKIHRGDWLCAQGMSRATSQIEADIKVLGNNIRPLRHNMPVHLHHGTARIGARVLITGTDQIPPASRCSIRLILNQPTHCCTGDRIILREAAGRRTIGGGRVIDPFPPFTRRKESNRRAISAALAQPDPATAMAELLALPSYEVDLQHFALCFNITPETAQQRCIEGDAEVLRGARLLAIPAQRAKRARDEILGLLDGLHKERPEAAGILAREIRDQLATPLSAEAFQSVISGLITGKKIELSGALVKLAGHSASYSAADGAMWHRALMWLDERAVPSFTLAELAGELRTSEAAVSVLLFNQIRSGAVWRITDKRFMLADQVSILAATASALDQQTGSGGFSAAQFRDAAGTGRTLAIHILEFFDRIGITTRKGDLRRMLLDFAAIVGEAPSSSGNLF